MDVASISMFTIATVIAVNYVIPRLEVARTYPWVFWAINVVDVVFALGVLMLGVPGFESHTVVRFLVGLVILMHLAQNFATKTRWDHEDRLARLDEELRQRRAFEDEQQP